jgi:hypothetical protein
MKTENGKRKMKDGKIKENALGRKLLVGKVVG